MPGSLVLVGGDPGIGKSTLLLQMCRNLADEKQMGGLPARVLYVSGEESQQQIKLRANRMGDFSDSLLVMCETNLSDIQEAIAVLEPQVVIIDSIQTMYSETVSSAPGSVSQVCILKETGMPATASFTPSRTVSAPPTKSACLR